MHAFSKTRTACSRLSSPPALVRQRAARVTQVLIYSRLTDPHAHLLKVAHGLLQLSSPPSAWCASALRGSPRF